MTDLKIHVGDDLDDMGRRFIDAWHRAGRGEEVRERHLSFDSFETLARVLTPKRMALLRHLRKHPANSVNALAKAVDRDYRRVHEDVEVLSRAGLIERANDNTGLSAPYDVIETRIAL